MSRQLCSPSRSSEAEDELSVPSSNDFSKNAIFTALDGSMTTFVTVAACWGADFPFIVVIVLGVAHLLGDGLVIGMGDLLLSQSEQYRSNMQRQQVQRELTSDVGSKVREMTDLYVEKGMGREDARAIVQTLAKYDHIFLEQLMVEQHGLLPGEEEDAQLTGSAITMLAFAFSGIVPLVPYMLSFFVSIPASLVPWSSFGLTAALVFTLGALKRALLDLEGSWLHSAVVMTANGGFAACIGYIVGLAFKKYWMAD